MIERMENEQEAGKLRMTRRMKSKTARDAAYDFANELLHVVANGPFWKAFSDAGKMYENAEKLDQLDSLYEEFAAAPSQELKQRMEELEGSVGDPLLTYTAFDGDPRKLKAADYENFFGNGLCIFDMCCRRRNGFACGLYASAFMWWRPTERWRFYCHMAYWLLDKDCLLYTSPSPRD